jgi:hypothetical protein
VKVFLILLAAAMTAKAVPNDPGKVAVDFLEKVRLRKLDLEPGGDTALSAQTAAGKKSQIARSLERMARDLGSDPLEVGAVKLDENFAAVLVRKVGGFDPTRLQIFPVALVKRDTEWTVAPVPASFENSGTGYAVELRKRLEKLENWMLREQVVDLEQLRLQSASRMREKIEVHLSAKDVRQMDSKTFGVKFLEACSRRDLPSMLGFLGGLAQKLPDDWSARLKAVEFTVAAGVAAPRPWRLLTSPNVARVLVEHEGDDRSALISIACLDPAGGGQEATLPQVEVIHFELSKEDNGLWQINPPDSFLRTSKDSDAGVDEQFDSELSDAFAAKWLEKNPLTPRATAEDAHQAMIAALGNGDFPAILAISKIDGEPSSARKACIRAAQIAWSVQNPSAIRHAVPLTLRTTESAAVGLFQFFSAQDPGRFEPTPLYFEKSANGWLLAPQPTHETLGVFQAWVDSETKSWRDRWQNLVLKDSPVLKTIGSLPAPTQAEAEALVKKWLETTRRGDVKAALELVARLDDPKSGVTVLQNLGYEITSSRRSTSEPAITAIHCGKTWTAVGVKIDQVGKSTFPLYPVIQTPQGPRILIEIDLFASQNRGREFLNKAAFGRLKEQSNTANELQNLYSEHQANLGSLPPKD